MRVFIAGATGVIGRSLVPLLTERGHAVVALARSEASAAQARQQGCEVVRGDILDAASLAPALRGVDVAVHLATSIPRSFPGKPADFAMNDRIRREGTRNLIAAATASGVRRLVAQSIVWVHGDARGAWIDESAPLKPGRMTQSAIEMEQHLQAAAGAGLTVSVLRCSGLYSADAYHTVEIIERLRKRLVPIIGAGDNYQDFIHAADAASAFALAIEHTGGGTWFVTDDEPATLATYLKWLASAVGAPEPIRVPQFMARLALGSEMLDAYSASLRCRNDRIKQALGWRPRYPSFRDGYAEVLPRLKGA